MTYKINPDIFFLLNKSGFILWDFLNHKQYLLEKKYIDVLIEISKNGHSSSIDIVHSLQESNIIGEYKDSIWGWDALSRIFHVGTSDLPDNYQHSSEQFAKEYLDSCNKKITGIKLECYEPNGEKISLPQPNLDLLCEKKLLDVLLKRKTSRHFNGEGISLENAALLLYITFANQARDNSEFEKNNLKTFGMRKTSPSGGSMHPSECYLIAFNIQNLSPGVYHYSSENHRLTAINKNQYSNDLSDLLRGQYFASKLSFGICITSRFNQLWQKYSHSRAYRIALMDVGHLSQTFQLCATSLDFLTWPTGIMQDSKMSKLLNLNDTEKPILFVGIGTGDQNALPENFEKYL